MKHRSSPILLFDGICNLCNHSVQYVLRHEKSNSLRFASLQSNFGKMVCKQHGLSSAKPSTIIYLDENGKIFTKSEAVIKIVSHLKFPHHLLHGIRIIPSLLRNRIYDLVAENRYRIFGQRESCALPDENQRDRFVDDQPYNPIP